MRASRWRRSLVAVATAGLLGFGTSGCTSDDDPPRPAPLPTNSPSATQRETSRPPSLPAEATGNTAKAAKAFAGHWVESLNFAAATGDAAAIRDLSSKECAACTAIADLIDEVHRDGGSIRGDGWETKRLSIVPSGGDEFVVDALVDVHPQVIVEKAGDTPKRFNGGRRLKTFFISSGPSGLLVERLDQPS